jgi:hypothetical protein
VDGELLVDLGMDDGVFALVSHRCCSAGAAVSVGVDTVSMYDVYLSASRESRDEPEK